MRSSARAERFVQHLEILQRQEGWTDPELARIIGCSTSMWNAVKRGRRTPGRTVMDGIFRKFPELQIAYALELREHAEPSVA